MIPGALEIPGYIHQKIMLLPTRLAMLILSKKLHLHHLTIK